jgi:glycosyltransferase involved in cell wall biosynthesis
VVKISIGLPVYNGGRYLRRSIETLLAQTMPDFELILVDNASTDETADICQEYRRRDARLVYHRNATNIGANPNWNRAFALATTPYFKWAADDDVHEPTFLEKTLAVLEADPGVVLCHCRTRFVDEHERDLPFDENNGAYRDSGRNLRLGAPLPNRGRSEDAVERFRDIFLHTVRCVDIFGLMRADALRRTALLRSYFGSDRPLLVELALLGRFHEVPEPLFLKRDHAGISLNLPEREKQVWIDTRNKRQRFLPQRLPYMQLVGAVMRAPITPAQKAQCLGIMAGRLARSGFWRRITRRNLEQAQAATFSD